MTKILSKKLLEKTSGFCDIIDITAKLRSELDPEKIRRGQVTLFVSGSSAALTTIEYEPGLVQDLKEFVERLIPSNRRYHHDERWGDDNGFSHLRASFFGSSRWSFRSKTACWRSGRGSKLFYWISTIARAPGKLRFSS